METKGNSDLLAPFCPDVEYLIVKKKERLCEANENTFTLNSYNIYPCSCLYLIVSLCARQSSALNWVLLIVVSRLSPLFETRLKYIRDVLGKGKKKKFTYIAHPRIRARSI